MKQTSPARESALEAVIFPWRPFLGATYVVAVGVALGVLGAHWLDAGEPAARLSVSMPIHPMAPRAQRPRGAYALKTPAPQLGRLAALNVPLYPGEEFPRRPGPPATLSVLEQRRARLGQDPQPPWRRFAAFTPPADNRPRVAIVIDDLGLNRASAERAARLPAPLTLAFLPYAGNLRELVAGARARGHEILVHLPMEPRNAQRHDTGPHALLVGLAESELVRRLNWNLNRFAGYVGVNNHMGSRFTADSRAMIPVMRELKSRGLLFLDSRTTPRSTGFGLARLLGVPRVGRDVFLDNERSARGVQGQLAEVERIAIRSGTAVAIGHPHAETLDALEIWMKDARRRGFVLVPVSAIAQTEQRLARNGPVGAQPLAP